MNTLLIGYDLNKAGQNYDNLITAIKDHATWWHHLDSTWIVKTSKSTVAMRDHLMKYIDSNDELLVVDITGDVASWYGFDTKGSQWLRDNL